MVATQPSHVELIWPPQQPGSSLATNPPPSTQSTGGPCQKHPWSLVAPNCRLLNCPRSYWLKMRSVSSRAAQRFLHTGARAIVASLALALLSGASWHQRGISLAVRPQNKKHLEAHKVIVVRALSAPPALPWKFPRCVVGSSRDFDVGVAPRTSTRKLTTRRFFGLRCCD